MDNLELSEPSKIVYWESDSKSFAEYLRWRNRQISLLPYYHPYFKRTTPILSDQVGDAYQGS